MHLVNRWITPQYRMQNFAGDRINELLLNKSQTGWDIFDAVVPIDLYPTVLCSSSFNTSLEKEMKVQISGKNRNSILSNEN